MKLDKLIKSMRLPAAVVLSLLLLLSVFGCSSAEIADNLELANDIIDIVGELSEETAEPDTESPDTESPATEESYSTGYYEQDVPEEAPIDEWGYYYSRDDVALYIHTYDTLPGNFITKDEARELGWEGGSVERYLEGAAIGGDVFGNREGLLPKAKGRTYYECDIDTDGENSRGAKRIVFSNDGLIYYTDDHYESFTLLYGEE